MRPTLLTCLALLTALLTGCAAPDAPATFAVPPGQYATAFDAAKDALREAGFEIERVDAYAGVITTRPRASAGFATPWIPHAGDPVEALGGLIHRQSRIATVRFEPADPEPVEGRLPPDLRAHEGAVAGAVRVDLLRVYRPGRRVDTTGVRLTTYSIDPELVALDLQPLHAVRVRADADLAQRLAARVRGRLAQPP